jgi:hypothetical protein
MAKATKPNIVYVRSDGLSSVSNSAIIGHTKNRIGAETPIDLKAIEEDLVRGHNYILEFSAIEFMVEDSPNTDLLYLSSFLNTSCMKQSFRRVPHNTYSLCDLVSESPIGSACKEHIASMYFNFNKDSSVNTSEDENLLPLSSTVDYIYRTNLRELTEMCMTQGKLPESLQQTLRAVVERLDADTQNIVQLALQLERPSYAKDRMFSDNFAYKGEGLVYDNCDQDIPLKDKYFVLDADITFKILSQLIRERHLGIELNLNGLGAQEPEKYASSLEYKLATKSSNLYHDLLSEGLSQKDALGVLPFSTRIQSRLTIPLDKIKRGFFKKQKANEPLGSFAGWINNMVGNGL